jgi:hypothetical protein
MHTRARMMTGAAEKYPAACRDRVFPGCRHAGTPWAGWPVRRLEGFGHHPQEAGPEGAAANALSGKLNP